MRKILAVLVMLAMLCTVPALAENESFDICLLVPAVGDASYFDGAAMGVRALAEEYDNVTADVVVLGRDPSVYDPFFEDACASGKYELIITGGGECTDALVKFAAAYPEQTFFDFDFQDTYERVVGLDNAYGVTYKVYDMGYLAGYLASQITVSDMPGANPEKKVGIVLGMDIVDINDFAGSFCQACIDAGVQADVRYANSFSDPEMGYAQAIAMYNEGCDIIWQVAGSAGAGVFRAAAETGRYAFGVDVDQTLTIQDEAQRATIVTSFYKDYAGVIRKAFDDVRAGSFTGGTYSVIGLAEGAVGPVDNEQYRAMVPEDIRAGLSDMYSKVISGEIVPYSVMAEPEKWEDIKTEATAAR